MHNLTDGHPDSPRSLTQPSDALDTSSVHTRTQCDDSLLASHGDAQLLTPNARHATRRSGCLAACSRPAASPRSCRVKLAPPAADRPHDAARISSALDPGDDAAGPAPQARATAGHADSRPSSRWRRSRSSTSTWTRSTGPENGSRASQTRSADICIFDTVSDDPETGLSRRVLRMGDLPIGALMLRGETRGRMPAPSLRSLRSPSTATTPSPTRAAPRAPGRPSSCARTVLDSLAHAYKTPLTVIWRGQRGPQRDGQPLRPRRPAWSR